MHLTRWTRIALVVGLVALTTGLAFYAYRYSTRPVTLTVAAGSLDGEGARLMNALASRLGSTANSRIRLKVVDTDTPLGAAEAFARGEVDLAIVRGDATDLKNARTVVVITHGVLMLLGLPGHGIEDFDGLKGKTIGVVGGPVNKRIASVLDSEYDLTRAKVKFVDLKLPEVAAAIQGKKVQALLIVTPISGRYLTMLRNFFPRDSKKSPTLLAIESAGAIAAAVGAYESFDVPKGTIRGSPAIPDDDLTTLRVPVYLVAKEKLDDDTATQLTQAIMETRGNMIGEHPILAQISAPSTEKDAPIRIHPGAEAYFSGDVKTIFDKYGDQFFYASMLLGMLSSMAAAFWKFMMPSPAEEGGRPPVRLHNITGRIRDANSAAELDQIEDEIDRILSSELSREKRDDSDAGALQVALSRLEYLISQRRRILEIRGAS
ncbi:TAXI family TRAP transporter solute-binding subunit [Pseudorhodoplanes sp.]|uniref:TAXI family TRAP transporter solute-binding subunit n=1 Tax=Pseudorhodoplanes sp. TaxID=1934341 RepID=UPI003D0B1642